MGLLPIETVHGGMPAVFLIELLRCRRPYIMVARRKEELVTVPLPDLADAFPFLGRRRVVAALDGIANVNDEGGVKAVDLAPDLLIISGLGLAGPFADDCKSE